MCVRGAASVDRGKEGGVMRRGEKSSPEPGGQRTEVECGSGHEAHRCIGSGFSWGSWLLEVVGRKEQSWRGSGGPVAMAAGTAGAQSIGT